MSKRKKKNRKIDGNFRRQISYLMFVLGNLTSIMDYIESEVRKYKEAGEPLPEKFKEDIKKITYLYRELMAKLQPYQTHAPLAVQVNKKILAGLRIPKSVSNLELAAFLMVVYFEEWKFKKFEFSKRFREIIFEIDITAFDDEEIDDKHTTELIRETVEIGEKIAYRYMKGDYIEFK